MMYPFPFYSPTRRYYRSFSPAYPLNPHTYMKKSNGNKSNLYQSNPKTIAPPIPDIKKDLPGQAQKDTVFEILGIKLYFDDLLLICLIFFLYNEGVQDQYLFIILVMLLLT